MKKLLVNLLIVIGLISMAFSVEVEKTLLREKEIDKGIVRSIEKKFDVGRMTYRCIIIFDNGKSIEVNYGDVLNFTSIKKGDNIVVYETDNNTIYLEATDEVDTYSYDSEY